MLTLDQAINDTIELTHYLRQRFDEPKIYVLGESWGSILGVLAVQRQPELFYAFIGSGQMVNLRETDRRFYQDVLDLAESTGNARLAAKMRSYGQPPTPTFPTQTFLPWSKPMRSISRIRPHRPIAIWATPLASACIACWPASTTWSKNSTCCAA